MYAIPVLALPHSIRSQGHRHNVQRPSAHRAAGVGASRMTVSTVGGYLAGFQEVCVQPFEPLLHHERVNLADVGEHPPGSASVLLASFNP